MTIAELILKDVEPELATTRKVLERVPNDPGYKPHDKSMNLGKLAMHVATLPLFGFYILTDASMDMAAPQHPHVDLVMTSPEALLQHFDDCAAKLRTALTGASDEAMAATWKFSFGDNPISNHSRAVSLRLLCLNHLIHHRAQLGVYLRLNNIPLPWSYGPSADEPFPR